MPPPAAPHVAIPDHPRQQAASTRLREPRVFNRRARRRFEAERLAAMTAHLGRAPSYAERLLIARLLAIEWELRRVDAKVEAGEELSGHALRARLAAENRLRLDLVALGLTPAPPRVPTLEEHLAAVAARRAAERAASPAAGPGAAT